MPPVDPTTGAGNVSEEGATPRAAETPVPVSGTDCGLPGALSVKDKLADRAPAAAGVKVTLTVQCAAGASVAAQVFAEITKSVAFVPVGAMLVILSVEAPVFVSVVVSAADVVLTF